MRKSRSTKFYTLAIVCLISLASPRIIAGPFSTLIKQAELVVLERHFVLNAELEILLSPIAERALQNGIPLNFEVMLSIERKRKWFWDETIKEISIQYQIGYLTTLNVYRLENFNNKQLHHYSTLVGALSALNYLYQVPVTEVEQLNPEQPYTAMLKIKFNNEDLPLPLRPEAYLMEEWSLSSQPYYWTISFPNAESD